jgi:uncharacterized membrane protein
VRRKKRFKNLLAMALVDALSVIHDVDIDPAGTHTVLHA